MLGIYAGKDGFVTPQAVKVLDDDLTRLGKRHEFHTYPGADHAFSTTRPEVYDAAAAADAWEARCRFFKRSSAFQSSAQDFWT